MVTKLYTQLFLLIMVLTTVSLQGIVSKGAPVGNVVRNRWTDRISYRGNVGTKEYITCVKHTKNNLIDCKTDRERINDRDTKFWYDKLEKSYENKQRVKNSKKVNK